MACIAYAIIGIPLNAILIGALGSVFSNKESISQKVMNIFAIFTTDNMPFIAFRRSVYLL